MADPTIQTFCCHHSNGSDLAVRIMNEFNTDSYNAVCLASSILGMCGAIYQILPREQSSTANRWLSFSATRGRKIIVWLAVADLLASLGLFTRSALWMRYKNIMPAVDDNTSVLFCAFSSAWTQYFYTATWLWTLCYAIDMRFVLAEKGARTFWYHTICWTVPAVLTSSGLCLLYFPDANCHSSSNLNSALLHILPNYMATYIPIAIVMIANPILYRSSTKDMEKMLTVTLGQFTRKEREVLDTIKIKFSLINAVFYICWIPNLINGILLWSLWFHLPITVTITVWYIMAFMNPLQAFFNCFVYRRWTKGTEKIMIPYRALCGGARSTSFNNNSIITSSSSTTSSPMKEENLPLLRSVPRSSINRLSGSSFNSKLCEKHYT